MYYVKWGIALMMSVMTGWHSFDAILCVCLGGGGVRGILVSKPVCSSLKII